MFIRWKKLYTIPDAEKRVMLVLITVLLLPIVAFSVFELSRLNNNESLLQEIYKNQLDAVLFSVNQYSNDILDKWASDLSSVQNTENASMFLEQFMFYNASVKQIVFFSENLEKANFYNEKYIKQQDEIICDSLSDIHFYTVLKQHAELLEKQKEFIKNDYRKIEVLPQTEDTLVPMVFALKEPIRNKEFVALIVDAQLFIEDVLAPKLQEVAKDKFIMTSFVKEPSIRQTYFTDSIALSDVSMSRPLWLLPEYYLGITLKGESIEALSKSRTRQNLITLLIIDVFLVLAIFLVYRNIRKEIALAKIKSEFVSNVSHEIRTPLAMISMFAETLLEGRIRTEEKKQAYYKMITDESQRLNNTVNQILNFSKIESGKRKFEFVEMDIQLIIEECIATHQRQFSLNDFEVIFKKAPTLPLVKVDHDALSEAINNLLDNAIKYSKDKKEIAISVLLRDKNVIINVQDYGIGIPVKYQKEIFNKFFRVPNHDVHDTKGSGLGLTMVKHIIEAHKGKINFKSTVNKGTTFSVQIPATNL